jgi:hypothetical protein
MAKIYLLEVIELCEVGEGMEPVCIFSKGHHDPQKFVEEVKREFDREISLTEVMQRYGRWEMLNTGEEKVQVLADHSEPGRGIFPVTIVDLY